MEIKREVLRICAASLLLVLVLVTQFAFGRTKSKAPAVPEVKKVLYSGKIYHIFFHSLVVYPELAFKNDGKGKLYQDYMVTREQFEEMLTKLYRNNFILIDISSIYQVGEGGQVSKKELHLPEGKKPLIISLDDLNYYSFMRGRGFANKLVLDDKGEVATEIVDPSGKHSVTRDGDVVPILDDFVKAHPDFSNEGAKGLIALTGFEGVLGYRTQSPAPDGMGQSENRQDRAKEIFLAEAVINKLKSTGWRFASHSYSHQHAFQNGSISLAELQEDTQKWQNEVEPLVGQTDIFIGPFGQVFQPGDPRRQYLVSQGYHLLAGVGMDQYLRYFDRYVMMDRSDIDGYRLAHSPELLEEYFGH